MKHFRVVEIFGPTIQGEGRRVGTPCYFIRFGGCDYRCTWCDSPHAVLPELISQVPKLNVEDIFHQLTTLPSGPKWVVLSGGNPALLNLHELMDMLQVEGYKTMVETQGTVFKDWLLRVDDLCISPKPPSSGNPTEISTTFTFLDNFGDITHWKVTPPYIKIPVFDDEDYEYLRNFVLECRGIVDIEIFASVGNDDPSLPTVGRPTPKEDPNSLWGTRDTILTRTRWLMEKISQDKVMHDVRVFPQAHALVWGNERGR